MSTTLSTLRYYTADYRNHPWLFAGALLMGPGYVLQNIISPLFVAKVLGELANHQSVTTSYLWLAAASLVSGVLITHFGDRYCSMPLTKIVMHNLRARCLEHLLKQEYGFFSNNFTGSLVTQTVRFCKGYEMFSNTLFLEIVGMWSGVVAAIVIMIIYNHTLGIVVGLLWLTGIGLVLFLVRRRIPVRRFAATKESGLTGELADNITNAITIKTFAREKAEEKRYSFGNNEYSQRLYRSWSMAINNTLLLQLLCVVLYLVVFLGGVHDIVEGSLTLAAFLLFQVYILRIIDSIMKAAIQMRIFEGVFGDSAEMTELLSRPPLVLDPPAPEPSQIKAGAIIFEHVQFTYKEQDSNNTVLLNDFNLNILAGEKVGLVGPSGGGKTTLTKLLLRFMDIQEGQITIDGQDIRQMTQDDLHKSISYVPQEPLLFHRTIKENIQYGRPESTNEEIEKAAEKSHAAEFISELHHGYGTLVGERGVKLSGGQRQRIAIARAMLKSAPVLVLDEATSALDSESEAFIQDSLWKLMQGKTTLVIAHRLSTIQRMDRIVVLDNGDIIEQGTHLQLLAAKGLYARLWAHQSGGFITGK